MKRILALLPLALTAATPASPARPPEETAERCEVALAYVQAMVAEMDGRKVVFSDKGVTLLEVPNVEQWHDRQGDRGVPAPSFALVDRVPNGKSAVAACAGVRAWLDGKRIAYGARAVAAATRGIDQLGSYRATILSVSLPAISTDHGEAVIASSIVHASLSGGASLQHLRRGTDGGWKQVSMIGLWVS